MSLRTKFNAILILAFLIGMAAAGGLAFVFAKKNALAEVRQETRLIHGQALAVRAYTAQEILPLLRAEDDILFLPHTVPSFSAQAVFARFRDRYPDYSYKEAALNPTNPADLAEPWEADLIQRLRDNPDLDNIAIERETPEGRFYTVAYPLTITDQRCLTCHSDPAAAPPAMIDLYGSENGFDWQLGETIGAQIIQAPIALAENRAMGLTITILVAMSIAFLIVLLILNLTLTRAVIRPVAAMSNIAERVSMGDLSQPEYVKSGKDEIASLSQSFNRMRRSLDNAMQMLED